MIVDPDYQGEQLVFIVGCPRSGTTWIQRLLSCHPRVRTGQESNLFLDSIGLQLRRFRRGLSLQERGGVGLGCYFTDAEMLALLRDFMRKLLQRMLEPVNPDQFFVEKTPDHALYLPEIIECLPASRVIHVVRDPRDVVASLIAASKTWASKSSWAPSSAIEGAKLWNKTMNAVSNAIAEKPPEHFLEVRYEALHQHPIETLTLVSRFIGIDWSPDEMQAALEANQIRPGQQGLKPSTIPLSGQAAIVSGPQVIDPEGFLRKGVPGSWKSDLSVLQKLMVWKVARHCAKKNGYRLRWFR